MVPYVLRANTFIYSGMYVMIWWVIPLCHPDGTLCSGGGTLNYGVVSHIYLCGSSKLPYVLFEFYLLNDNILLANQLLRVLATYYLSVFLWILIDYVKTEFM